MKRSVNGYDLVATQTHVYGEAVKKRMMLTIYRSLFSIQANLDEITRKFVNEEIVEEQMLQLKANVIIDAGMFLHDKVGGTPN